MEPSESVVCSVEHQHTKEENAFLKAMHTLTSVIHGKEEFASGYSVLGIMNILWGMCGHPSSSSEQLVKLLGLTPNEFSDWYTFMGVVRECSYTFVAVANKPKYEFWKIILAHQKIKCIDLELNDLDADALKVNQVIQEKTTVRNKSGDVMLPGISDLFHLIPGMEFHSFIMNIIILQQEWESKKTHCKIGTQPDFQFVTSFTFPEDVQVSACFLSDDVVLLMIKDIIYGIHRNGGRVQIPSDLQQLLWLPVYHVEGVTIPSVNIDFKCNVTPIVSRVLRSGELMKAEQQVNIQLSDKGCIARTVTHEVLIGGASYNRDIVINGPFTLGLTRMINGLRFVESTAFVSSDMFNQCSLGDVGKKYRVMGEEGYHVCSCNFESFATSLKGMTRETVTREKPSCQASLGRGRRYKPAPTAEPTAEPTAVPTAEPMAMPMYVPTFMRKFMPSDSNSEPDLYS